MIGPSSSHTAGACRIGYAAGRLLAEKARRAVIQLHGSFLATGEGHGTREALVAGLLGMAPDDERLIHSLDLAEGEGIEVTFEPVDFGPLAHPNGVRLLLEGASRALTLRGSSVGAANVVIEEIDDMAIEIRGTLETLVLWHNDAPGFLASVTAVLACAQINVATIRTSRLERGETAITAVEVDGRIPAEIPALLDKSAFIHRLVILPPLPGF